jgi:hypothetical protein
MRFWITWFIYFLVIKILKVQHAKPYYAKQQQNVHAICTKIWKEKKSEYQVCYFKHFFKVAKIALYKACRGK